MSRWADTYAARTLGDALTIQPEFWEHVKVVRADAGAATALARLYVRRNQGRRVELISAYLLTAAAEPSRRDATLRLLNIAPVAWTVGAEVSDSSAPQRALRPDAAETIANGAIRVARRGAGRCMEPSCCDWMGAKLAADNTSGYCFAHAGDGLRRPREAGEGERSMFDAAIPVVLRDEPSRPGRRRARRAATGTA